MPSTILDNHKLKRDRSGSKTKAITGFFASLHRRSKRGKDSDKTKIKPEKDKTKTEQKDSKNKKSSFKIRNGRPNSPIEKNIIDEHLLPNNNAENGKLDNQQEECITCVSEETVLALDDTDSLSRIEAKHHTAHVSDNESNEHTAKVSDNELKNSGKNSSINHEQKIFSLTLNKKGSKKICEMPSKKFTTDPFTPISTENHKRNDEDSNDTNAFLKGSLHHSSKIIKNDPTKIKQQSESEEFMNGSFKPITMINKNSKTVVLNTFQSFDNSPQSVRAMNKIKKEDQISSSSDENLLETEPLQKTFPKFQSLNHQLRNHKLTKLKSMGCVSSKKNSSESEILLNKKHTKEKKHKANNEPAINDVDNIGNKPSNELSSSLRTTPTIESSNSEEDDVTNTSRVPCNKDTKKSAYSLDKLDVTITLGTGTFGRVFLAEQHDDDTVYAMKIMKMKDIIKLNQVEHVNSERNVLRNTDHPFIVKSYWTFRDEKCLYMLMEYVPGGELFTYLRNQRKFTASDALFYVAEIISVLEYLHAKDIVYRDLKPENLLLDREGHLKFTDFGFSKIIHDTTWTLCGTPEYLSPEAIQGKGHDVTCDWWALGILTYEMLVGEAPFVDTHPFGLYEKILACEIGWPSYLKETEQQNFIEKLVVVDRNKRLGKGSNGTEDVKNHAWLRYINWNDVYNRKLKPPIKPKVAFKGDTSNFDDFDENWELRHVPEVTEAEIDKFSEWETK